MRLPAFKRLAIYGAGGLGREVLQVLRTLNSMGAGLEAVGFLIDPAFSGDYNVQGFPVYRDLAAFANDDSVGFVVAVGNPPARARIACQIEKLCGPRFASLIHPACWIGDYVSIGHGTMILGPASVTTDVRIGQHVLVNPGVTIAHDCNLENFATLSPATALAGNVLLEMGAELGTGAKIAPKVTIGRWAIVGAGAVVLNAVPPNTTVVGIPARVIRHRPDGWERDI